MSAAVRVDEEGGAGLFSVDMEVWVRSRERGGIGVVVGAFMVSFLVVSLVGGVEEVCVCVLR